MSGSPVVIVSGSAGGIGSAVCTRLLSGGWTVVGADVAPLPGDQACDVTSAPSVNALIERVILEHGGIDALVAAAGFGQPSPFLDASDELWAQMVEVNLMGTVRLCRAALPSLLRSSYEARGIVTFTSQAAKTGGLVIGAPYSAAKAAVMCLTKTLAAEFSPRGVRVNGVAPGIVETPFLDAVPAIRAQSANLPLRRLGTPGEVASVVHFLLSTDASYITGEIVDVNGGLYMD